MSATTAKLVAAGLAIAALVASAFVHDATAQASLFSIASGLVGWQFLPRAGDAPRSTHPDDLP